MINKRFLNFKTYNGFLAKKDQIPEDSIVFIQDKPCIWARGKEYVCDGPYGANATDGLFQFKNGKNEVIFTISQNDGILTLTDSKGNTIDTEYVSKLQFNAAKRETDYKITNIENSKADKIDIATFATQNDIVNSLAEYQRKLIAGSGIRINSNEEISCTLDTDVYEVVDEFPTGDDINPNKLYIKQEQSGDDTVFIQYKWDSDLQDWVSFGRVQPAVSLEKYITRAEAARSFAPIDSYVTTTQFERTVGVINDMFANIDYASNSDISDIYQQMSNYLTASDLNGYVTAEELLELRQFVVDNYVHNSRLYTLKEGEHSSTNPGGSSSETPSGGSSESNPGTGTTPGGTTTIINNITLDTELSLTSPNAVQNWVITSALRNKVDNTVLPELARKTDLNTKADTSLLNNYVTKDSLNNSLKDKQDTLHAGSGISIEDGQISVTLDTKPFIIVDELPTTNIDENKIYILRETVDDETVYVEFRRINNTWQEVGTKQLNVDLSGYYTKSESDERYLIAEGTYLTTTEAQQTYQSKRDDYVVSEDISELLTNIADIYQEKGDFALRQDVANALTRLQQVIDQKYVLKADVYYNQDVDWSNSTPVNIPVNQSDNGSSNGDCSSKMVTLTASQYAQLVEDNLVQQDVYYFTYEGEAPSAGWQFGGAFPITFTENWAFGQAFPITLN